MKNFLKNLFKSKEQIMHEKIEARVVMTAKKGNACILLSELTNAGFIAYMKDKYDMNIVILDGGTKYKVFMTKED